MAVLERFAPRDGVSHWYRFHIRQALWFGNIAAAAGLAALVWPLLITLVVTNLTAVLWIYALAFVQDAVLLIAWLLLALRYSRGAARGKFFVIPIVARITGSASPTP